MDFNIPKNIADYLVELDRRLHLPVGGGRGLVPADRSGKPGHAALKGRRRCAATTTTAVSIIMASESGNSDFQPSAISRS